MKSVKNEILNETKIAKSIIRLSHEIIEKNNGTDEIYLVGIITRGKTLAERIHKNLSKLAYQFSTIVFPHPQRGACIFGNFSGSLYCFLSIFRRCKREEMHHVVF